MSRAREHLEMGCDLYEKGQLFAAEKEFLRAAGLGSIEAQVNLGNLYSSHDLRHHQINKAICYYRKATQRRSPQAAWNLALTYRELGKVGLYWFWIRRAAVWGDVEAKEGVAKFTDRLSRHTCALALSRDKRRRS